MLRKLIGSLSAGTAGALLYKANTQQQKPLKPQDPSPSDDTTQGPSENKDWYIKGNKETLTVNVKGISNSIEKIITHAS